MDRVKRRKASILIAVSSLALSANAIGQLALLQTPEDDRIRSRIAAIMDKTVHHEVVVKGVTVWTRMPPSSESVAEIKSFGDKAVPALTAYLKDEDPRIRDQAIF